MSDLIPVIEAIDAILPQTQCTKCGYQGCKPYAEAIANGDAINKCPPGGAGGIARLAALLDRPALPLDTSHGHEPVVPLVAYIREAECIGCTKCIQACPVDAIIGAAKLMHTVVTDICTGCDLCVAPCPVDCIDMVPAPVRHPDNPEKQAAADMEKAGLSRLRFQRRNARLARFAAEKQARRNQRALPGELATATPDDRQARVKASVQAALAAVRERASQQSTDEQREKLERTLASTTERFERAEAKVREAEQSGSDQLPMLLARREDMRFKLEESRRKLDALDRQANFGAAVERMTAARSHKTDAERIANGMAVIDQKLSVLQEKLLHAQGTQRLALEAEMARLQAKQQEAGQALRDLDDPAET